MASTAHTRCCHHTRQRSNWRRHSTKSHALLPVGRELPVVRSLQQKWLQLHEPLHRAEVSHDFTVPTGLSVKGRSANFDQTSWLERGVKIRAARDAATECELAIDVDRNAALPSFLQIARPDRRYPAADGCPPVIPRPAVGASRSASTSTNTVRACGAGGVDRRRPDHVRRAAGEPFNLRSPRSVQGRSAYPQSRIA